MVIIERILLLLFSFWFDFVNEYIGCIEEKGGYVTVYTGNFNKKEYISFIVLQGVTWNMTELLHLIRLLALNLF